MASNRISIERLANHFNVKRLMDLFRLDYILEKIKNFTFFIHGQLTEIIKDRNGDCWYVQECHLGDSVKIKINESTMGFMEILRSEFLSLIGKTAHKTKATKDKVETKSHGLGEWLLIGVASMGLGYIAYRKFK